MENRSDLDKKIVIITVPHARYGRGWDETSLPSAKSLIENIRKYGKNLKPVLFVPMISREKCDLNRYSDCSLNSSYYKEIKTFIEENQEDIEFLLDVHSFNKFPDIFKMSEIAILDDELYLRHRSDFSLELNNYLKENGINSNIFHGKTNLLHSSLRSSKIKTTLLEFEEHLSKERLDETCRRITIFLNSYIEK